MSREIKPFIVTSYGNEAREAKSVVFAYTAQDAITQAEVRFSNGFPKRRIHDVRPPRLDEKEMVGQAALNQGYIDKFVNPTVKRKVLGELNRQVEEELDW